MNALTYHITLVTRQSFFFPKQKKKNPDLSYKTDLDLLDC